MNARQVGNGRVWLCWSFSQCAPHIESEADGLRSNIRAFLENRAVDYVPIAVFDSDEEAHNFLKAKRSLFEGKYSEHRDRRGF
jgi:hypothetical protein